VLKAVGYQQGGRHALAHHVGNGDIQVAAAQGRLSAAILLERP
jgi:hypothetical protein